MSVEKLIENLKNKINDFAAEMEISEAGQVLSVADGIAKISGLSKCQSSEMNSVELLTGKPPILKIVSEDTESIGLEI